MTPSEAAQFYLDMYWDGSLPVDPIAIARRDGVGVYDLQELDDHNDLSGAYFPAEQSKTGKDSIYVNRNDTPNRFRFTIAHELGHHALNHGHAFRDTNANYYTQQHDYREVQANNFAASLLMPEGAVNVMIKKYKMYDIEELSEVFAVSNNAMRFRLINLGWLENE